MARALAVLFLLFVTPAAAVADDPAARYDTLLAAAKKGDKPVDWQALRFAYADGPAFDLLGMRTADIRKRMFETFKAGDYAGAITQAKLVLDQNFVDIDAHIVCDLAERNLGHVAEADRQRKIVVGLVASIRTGDGKTPATAYTVISVPEEYALLRALGLRSRSQALIHQGDHGYDLLETIDRTGQSRQVYFLIDRVLAAESKPRAQ